MPTAPSRLASNSARFRLRSAALIIVPLTFGLLITLAEGLAASSRPQEDYTGVGRAAHANARAAVDSSRDVAAGSEGEARGNGSPRAAVDSSRIVVARFKGEASNALDDLTAHLGGRRVGEISALSIEVIAFPRADSEARLQSRLSAYSAHPGVRWAEPDTIVTIDPVSESMRSTALGLRDGSEKLAPALMPDDPRYGEQWGLDMIGMPRAWDVGKADGVVIAIVDTGVDCTHEDLAAACVEGFDVVDDDSDPMDENRHGTIQAGVAAAVTNNGVGISGVAWGARIMPLRAMAGDGSGTGADIAEAIVWAADHGADVINLSLGSNSEILAVTEAVRYSRTAGATIAAAAGNSGSHELRWPAALNEVMGIAATTRADTRASFSTQGDHVYVAAPGWQLLTTDLGGEYNLYDGTSEATSFVSGFAALLIAQDSSRTPDDVERIIKETAVDLGAAGWDEHFGWGRIDVAAALEAGAPPSEPTPPSETVCTRPYRLLLHAFPDSVGVGVGGRRCRGCDRVFSSGDRMAAAWCGLGTTRVKITSVSDATRVLWEGDLARSVHGDARASLALCVPPPWNIEITSPDGSCLTLCPNTPALTVLDQSDVDALSGSRRGLGRKAEVSWSFWSCAP